MHDAVEEPLDVHLALPPQGESVETQGRTDISEDRFYSGEPLIIDEATLQRIYFAFHLFGEALGKVGSTSLKEVDLADFRTVGVAEAFLPKSATQAVSLIAPELDGDSFMIDDDITPIAVETASRRTDAVFLIIAHGKVACRKGSCCTMGVRVFFSRALLETLGSGKAGIAYSELLVCYAGIDTFFHKELHVRFRVEAGIGRQFGRLE